MDKRKANLSRRAFLSSAAAGVVSAGIAGMCPVAGLAQQAQEKKAISDQIIYRRIERTGMRLPIVSMGVMNANNPAVVQASYELGVRHFDTAAFYQFGANEQMVGGVISKMGVRDKVNIGTKSYLTGQRVSDPKEVVKKITSLCLASLGRLKTDYVDIFSIHDVSNGQVPADPAVMEALAILKDQKKILAAGLSTHSNMADVINAAAATGFYDVIITAINFTMAGDAALLGAIENAARKGMGIVAMKTLAGGSRWPNPDSRQNYPTEVVVSAALKWVLNNPHVTTAIPGYDNFDQMRQSFAFASNPELTEQEKKFLSDNKVVLGFEFCRQCRRCLASCPNGVDVPTLMRTHMYAAQYGNLVHARQTYDTIPEGQNLRPCGSCGECAVQCANSVNIDRRIRELKTMYV